MTLRRFSLTQVVESSTDLDTEVAVRLVASPAVETSAPIEAWEVKLEIMTWQTDQPTDRPADRQTWGLIEKLHFQ